MKHNVLIVDKNPEDRYTIVNKTDGKVVYRLGKKLKFRTKFACEEYFRKLYFLEQIDYEIIDNYPMITGKGKKKNVL